jgi:D-psicose/D-tagatose/L-ribulose 3-epimerase
MRLGICTSPDGLELAAAAGFDYAELATFALLPAEDDAAFAPVLDRLRNAPLPIEAVNCFVPGHLKVTGPTVDLVAVGAHMDRMLGRAAAVGAKIMVFGSGGARRAPEGFSLDEARAQYVTACRMAGDLAGRHGLTIALEPLNTDQCNFFNRVDEGAALVTATDHPRVRLLADLFHMWKVDDPSASIPAAAALFGHLHLATPALPETKPDGAAFDFDGFLAAVKAAGYDGRLSVEDNPGFLGGAPSLAEAYRAIVGFLRGKLAG